MRKICGVDDESIKRVKDIYLRKKEKQRQEVGRALNVHIEMVIRTSVMRKYKWIV